MITATGKKPNYHTELSDGKHTFCADTPVAAGGSDDYPRPGDLLASGLAACMNITARKLLDQQGISYREVRTFVDLDRSNPWKSVFRTKTVIDADCADAVKEEILAKVQDCAVCNILRGEKEFLPLD